MDRLNGRVALITGAAGGVGRAAAEIFAAQGARVFLGDIDQAGLEETAARVNAAGGSAAVQVTDVSRAEQCQELVERAVEWAGALHTVVNNAAVGQFDATVETLSEEAWDRVLDINLKSVFLVSKYAIPHLRAAGNGVILNVVSPHAFATTEGVCAYAASKGGALALSRQMAMDLARDSIRVIPVIPGAVDTPMLQAHAERQNTTLDALGFYSDPRKIGRIGSPEELARALAFLASDEASYFNASPVVVDAGLLARL